MQRNRQVVYGMLIYDTHKDYRNGESVPFKCSVCGYEGVKRYSHILNGIGCPACNGKAVKVGFNDLWTTRPDVAEFLLDPSDGFRFVQYSGKRTDFICRNCGHVSNMRIRDVSKRGFHCQSCSTGISYPNRVMMALLHSLNLDFERECSFQWSGRRRYDFYIPPDVIIEMHGGQHYHGFKGNAFIPFDEITKRDLQKKELAISNGISEYIVIDSSESNIDYIAQSITNSRLSEMVNLTGVNWARIDKAARASFYNSFVDLYKYFDATPREIADLYGVAATVVTNTLKTANANGDCVYDARKNSIDAALINCQRAHENNKKPVRCVTTGKEFDSLNSACEYYGLNPKALSRCLTGHSESSGKLNGQKLQWEYINKE